MKIIELDKPRPQERIVRAAYRGETYVLLPNNSTTWIWFMEPSPSGDMYCRTCGAAGQPNSWDVAYAMIHDRGATLLDDKPQVGGDWQSPMGKVPGNVPVYAQDIDGYGWMLLWFEGDIRCLRLYKWGAGAVHVPSSFSTGTTDKIKSMDMLLERKQLSRVIIPESPEDHGRIITALMRGEEVKA